MPKPTKLTTETHKKIVRLVRGGLYLDAACAASDIGVQTLRDWRIRGAEKPDSIYGKFAADIELALRQDEARTVLTHERLSAATVQGKGKCQECGSEVTVSVPVPGNVQLHALQWKLERKFPKRYGSRVKVELETEMETVFAKLEKHLSPEEFSRVLEILDAPDS